MKRLALGLILALTSCGGYEARFAQTQMIGSNVRDLVSCAGVPDHVQRIYTNEYVFEYAIASNAPVHKSFVLTYGGATLNSGASGQCAVSFRIKNGDVIAVHYSHAYGGYIKDDACAPLIDECLRRPDHTTLPADYNMDQIYGGK